MKKKVTTADIKIALRRLYTQPEWALLFEVGDATGARHSRFADALAMSLWPSRGLSLTGMEIKVSRSDWHRERQQPQKAETIAAYCDYWTLVTAPKVVLDMTEIPPAWGWMEYDGQRFTTHKNPEKTEAKEIGRTFLAALLRRAHKTDEEVIAAEVAREREIEAETFEQRVEMAAARRSSESERLKNSVEVFEAATGIMISELAAWGGEAKELGAAAKVLRETGILKSYGGLRSIASDLKKMAFTIDQTMDGLGFPAGREPKLSDFVRKRRKA